MWECTKSGKEALVLSSTLETTLRRLHFSAHFTPG